MTIPELQKKTREAYEKEFGVCKGHSKKCQCKKELNFLESTILETAKLVVEGLIPEKLDMDSEIDEFQRHEVGYNSCREDLLANARAMGIGE
jgi:hypothetical protein